MSVNRQIVAAGTSPAPLNYSVQNAAEIQLLAVNATFDGTNAAADFVPAVVILSDGGVVVARVVSETTVSAGDAASASFFPDAPSVPAVAASTTLWWRGGLDKGAVSPIIPDSTWTQVTFSARTGPGGGSGADVEFDTTTSAVIYNGVASGAEARWMRFSAKWAAGGGTKMMQFRATKTGSASLWLNSPLAVTDWAPTNESTQNGVYQEIVALTTPFVFTLGPQISVTSWVWQNSGGPLQLLSPTVDVFGIAAVAAT